MNKEFAEAMVENSRVLTATKQQEFYSTAQMKVRRERIATAALQGLLTCPDIVGSPTVLVTSAVAFTDALIAELDKEKVPDGTATN